MAACKSTAHCAASFFTISFFPTHPKGAHLLPEAHGWAHHRSESRALILVTKASRWRPSRRSPELWNDLDEGDRPEQEETEGELSG